MRKEDAPLPEYKEVSWKGFYFSFPVIGVGIGLLAGEMLYQSGWLNFQFIHLALVCIFAGLGFVIAEKTYSK